MIEIGDEIWGTTSEVAEAMQISRRTVRRYVAAGTVRTYGTLRCVNDIVAAEKAGRARMHAGVTRQQGPRHASR